MLMVIFGAGASYDSVSSFTPNEFPRQSIHSRPPLASELFLRIDHFRNHLDVFPQCRPIITYLEPHGPGSLSVEEELERLQSETAGDADRISQLVAIRYYLRNLIKDCQQQWTSHAHGVSNYHSLWDQIRRATPVLAVTFNYDTLFENALTDAGIVFRKMSDYITDPPLCRLIKPHGSINWENMVESSSIPTVGRIEVDDHYLISRAGTFKPSKIYRLAGDTGNSSPATAWWPALAIPTVSKSYFACPDDHLQAFRESAANVTKILIVGWRAAEQHFLKELVAAIRRPVHVCAVCESEKAALEPLEQLKIAGIRGELESYPFGFTGFVQNCRIEVFLRRPELS
jgi:hypothetical protein